MLRIFRRHLSPSIPLRNLPTERHEKRPLEGVLGRCAVELILRRYYVNGAVAQNTKIAARGFVDRQSNGIDEVNGRDSVGRGAEDKIRLRR